MLVKKEKLKNRNDIRIDHIISINLDDPSSLNMVSFQLLIESNILSCYINNNLDTTLFTKKELDKYNKFIDFAIDNFESNGLFINKKPDEFLTGLIRKASISRLFKMIDPIDKTISNENLFITRLKNIRYNINETDSKDLAYFLYTNFREDIPLDRLKGLMYNPHLTSLFEYLMNGNLIMEIDEQLLNKWIMFIDYEIDAIKGPNYYRLRHSLVNVINKYNNIQEAKGYLGYERLELE
ncbi:hypothetical protein CPT_MarsHill_104 [Staphylococcus phage MarsHill]|nr:hypothetical protein CPT_MarsHill_104 [Staphylococcus phage MarsHill]QQO92759.1 hypothetical protein CPT_Madawaska_104 [Staphylococcus phage Madawaska]